MSQVLFDVNVPRPLAAFLTRHAVVFAEQRGWPELANGELLAAAEAGGFDVMVTADTNLQYQQNLIDRRIAIVTLSTNAWPVIRTELNPVIAAVDAASPGSFQEVTFMRPPLLQRSPPVL